MLDPLAAIVVCDTMPNAVAQKIGPDRDWFGPSADLTIHLSIAPVRDGCSATTGAARRRRLRVGRDGAVGSRRPSLVAYATQMMFFAFGI